MSLLSLLRHRLRAFWRAPLFKQRAASLVVSTLMALYLGGGLVVLGLAFDNVVREVAPSTDPVLVLARWLLPLGLVHIALRVVMESDSRTDLQPYLHLPLRRGSLLLYRAVSTLLSFWNAVPLLFFVAVCGEAAARGAGMEALRLGLAAAGVLVATTCLAPMARWFASRRPFLLGGTLLVGAVATGTVTVESVADVSPFLSAFGEIPSAVVRGEAVPTVAAFVLLIGVMTSYACWLRGGLALDQIKQPRMRGGTLPPLHRLAGQSAAWREAVLELRLALRNAQLIENARPRLQLFYALAGASIIVMISFFSVEVSDLSVEAGQAFGAIVVPGLAGTGMLIFGYGRLLFAWEGHAFEGMMARPVPPRRRIEGKLLFLVTGVIICSLIPLPFLLFSRSPYLFVQIAFLLYSSGFWAPTRAASAILSWSVSTRRRREMGTLIADILINLVPIGLPILPFFLFDRLSLQLGSIALLGLLSMLSMPTWIRFITSIYRRDRYGISCFLRTK
ncbi:MAG: DUF5687 family protein [Salinivenus sp.]